MAQKYHMYTSELIVRVGTTLTDEQLSDLIGAEERSGLGCISDIAFGV